MELSRTIEGASRKRTWYVLGMKVLIIGGNRFVGLRLSHILDKNPNVELHVLNRTGQVAHTKNTVIYKGDRKDFKAAHVDQEWDVVVDFACFNRQEAEGAVAYFTKVKHYIFISTMSVYDLGTRIKESAFDPKTYDLETPFGDKDPGLMYQYGKRQAEGIFAQRAPYPVFMVRFPLLVGPDDYTHRLEFHIERVQNNKPIYIPNPQAFIPMIHSKDAAEFLNWSLEKPYNGPLNVASPDVISLRDLMTRIEKATGRKALLVNHQAPENDSPYGVPSDYTLNTDQLQAFGYKVPQITTWIDELIELFSDSVKSRVH